MKTSFTTQVAPERARPIDTRGRSSTAVNRVGSDQDFRELLSEELSETFGGLGKSTFIDSVFSEEKAVVFEMDSQADGRCLFRVQYTEGADGSITFGDPVPVQRVTTFVPATNGRPPAHSSMAFQEVITRASLRARAERRLDHAVATDDSAGAERAREDLHNLGISEARQAAQNADFSFADRPILAGHTGQSVLETAK